MPAGADDQRPGLCQTALVAKETLLYKRLMRQVPVDLMEICQPDAP